MSQIRLNQIRLPFHKMRIEYEWQGDDAIAELPEHYLRYGIDIHPPVGAEFWLDHLNLIVIDYCPSSAVYTVGLMGGRSYQAMVGRRIRYALDNIKCRIILTLYVWGLADLSEGQRISWRSVHWGRKRAK